MNFLQKLTQVVDKGVAKNYAIVVIVGAVVPLAPLLLIEDAPIERYPILTALAMFAALSWGAFVTWRYLRQAKIKLDSLAKASKYSHFWPLIICATIFLLAVALGEFWLSAKIGWPESYGLDCGSRSCRLETMVHSPRLLSGGGAIELGVFALMWAPYALGLASLIYLRLRRSRRTTNIRPD